MTGLGVVAQLTAETLEGERHTVECGERIVRRAAMAADGKLAKAVWKGQWLRSVVERALFNTDDRR